jgi:hypothetical protein
VNADAIIAAAIENHAVPTDPRDTALADLHHRLEAVERQLAILLERSNSYV